jgi:hypothetical protein
VLVEYIDHGKGAPNRFFVQDVQASQGGNTKYRYEHRNMYYEMKMIPGSFYSKGDHEHNPFTNFGGQSQFDIDRRAWLDDGAKYSDLDFVDRWQVDYGDNSDADEMWGALSDAFTAVNLRGGGEKPSLKETTIKEPVGKTNEIANKANGGNDQASISNAATGEVNNSTIVTKAKGVNNANTKNAANIGNKVHYDQLNGSTGQQLPTQLAQKYPNTQFRFLKRGQAGADVEVTGGTHPSEYPGSTWVPGNKYGDFKPNTPSGKTNFNREVKSGKLPKNTQKLSYDPTTGKLL